MQVPMLGDRTYVHVSTSDQAIEVLTYLHEREVKWGHGVSLLSNMYLNELDTYNYYWFGEEEGLYRSEEAFEPDINVIEFEDLDIANRSVCEPISDDSIKLLFEV